MGRAYPGSEKSKAGRCHYLTGGVRRACRQLPRGGPKGSTDAPPRPSLGLFRQGDRGSFGRRMLPLLPFFSRSSRLPGQLLFGPLGEKRSCRGGELRAGDVAGSAARRAAFCDWCFGQSGRGEGSVLIESPAPCFLACRLSLLSSECAFPALVTPSPPDSAPCQPRFFSFALECMDRDPPLMQEPNLSAASKRLLAFRSTMLGQGSC